MMFTCVNETTAEWVEKRAKILTPWDGAKLKAADERKLPKAIIVYFPNSA